MKFRPCIDLHEGVVKQIVGATLNDDGAETNFIASHPASFFVEMFREDNLTGGHIIKLGQGNDQVAQEALASWCGGMQLGGGINEENASFWIDAGASHVIVTTAIFCNGEVDMSKLKRLTKKIGKNRLVLDLSCRKRDGDYFIVTDRWQKFTNTIINSRTLESLSAYCVEFLVHGVDVEGKCAGVEEGLIGLLAAYSPIPTTYAGGISSADDIEILADKGLGRLDYTVGSSLDIFGGSGLNYRDLIKGT